MMDALQFTSHREEPSTGTMTQKQQNQDLAIYDDFLCRRENRNFQANLPET